MTAREMLASRLARLRSRPQRSVSPESGITAAVALVVALEEAKLLLIRRATRNDDRWSGHVALPGGRRAPADADSVATAIRETREEVGLDLITADLVGQLGDTRPRSQPGYGVVRPFVFCIPRALELRLSDEVAAAEWLDAESLGLPATETTVEFVAGSERIRLPARATSLGPMWGMTERIVAEFFTV